MSDKHTTERLKVADDGSLGSIETASGKPIGQTFQTRPIRDAVDHEERKANARRLVACWNACDGVPTDALEQIEGFGKAAIPYHQLKAQRDALLFALKACAAVCAGETLNKNSLVNALELSRAAIAAAEKGGAS